MQIYLLYFIITGLYCYFKVSKLQDYVNLPAPERDELDDLISQIYVQFGMSVEQVLPILQIFALLLGWLLLPMSIVQTIIDKFKL